MPEASAVQRLLSPVVEVRREEAGSLLLMFLYSFLVMTAYNIVKPLTRAQFISALGADNLPWVLLVSGVLVGAVMQLYAKGASRLPPRTVIAATHVGIAALLAGFWAAFRAGAPGASVPLLPGRADPRPAPDQPVLGAGERRLRRPAGEAAVRLHRRRREPRGDDRVGGGRLLGRRGRGRQPAARQQRAPRRLRRRRHRRRARGAGRGARRRRFDRGAGGGRRPGGAADAARVAPPAAHRPDHRVRRHRRRPARPAAQHGGGGVGRKRRNRPDCGVPGSGAALPVARRTGHPGRADEPHPPSSRHRVRAADPADRPRGPRAA